MPGGAATAASARLYFHGDSAPEVFRPHTKIEGALEARKNLSVDDARRHRLPRHSAMRRWSISMTSQDPRALVPGRIPEGGNEPAIQAEGFSGLRKRLHPGQSKHVITIHQPRMPLALCMAGLELAEQIRTALALGTAWVGPWIAIPTSPMRGHQVSTSRLRSAHRRVTTDMSDSAQFNIETVVGFRILARLPGSAGARPLQLRLACWNLHPFPSMVKVPDYPGRSRSTMCGGRSSSFAEDYSTRARGYR